MDEDYVRSGRGAVTSSADAKLRIGRTSFRRPQKHHTGNLSRSTEWRAQDVLDKGNKPPTETEKEILFEENPHTVQSYRNSGFSDDQIYDILSNST